MDSIRWFILAVAMVLLILNVYFLYIRNNLVCNYRIYFLYKDYNYYCKLKKYGYLKMVFNIFKFPIWKLIKKTKIELKKVEDE